MRIPLRCLLIAVVFLAPISLPAGNWPQWRGPEGNGLSRDSELPIAWTESSGLAWKTTLPEWGNSTPAVWGDAIFLTSHVENRQLVLLRLNKKTGKIEWTREVGSDSIQPTRNLNKPRDQRRHQQFHADHNLASPSPVTDGEVVVAHFGNGDLAAYDFEGKQLWKRNLQQDHGDYTIWWGHANSPVLHQNLVISVCMQDSCKDLPGEPAPSYVVAHDKRTGKQKWKTMRMTAAMGESCDSYTTPIFCKTEAGTALVVMGGQVLDAYLPATGERLWHMPRLTGNRTITGPVASQGMIYATQGMRQAMLAVRQDGEGERPHKDVVWKFEQGTPDSPSPTVWGEWLFIVNNDGVVRCFEVHKGHLLWKERLKGEYRASPVAADARVYFLNTKGLCTVVSASPRFDRLTESRVDDDTFASPAIADGKLLIRGKKMLYCVTK
jgi:outer membrane protein assembly factor BamB